MKRYELLVLANYILMANYIYCRSQLGISVENLDCITVYWICYFAFTGNEFKCHYNTSRFCLVKMLCMLTSFADVYLIFVFILKFL